MVTTRSGNKSEAGGQDSDDVTPTPNNTTPNNTNNNKNNTNNDGEELSEEDQHLKDELTMLVTRLTEKDVALHKPALESIRSLIRSATTSMTSVPKPLKFLRSHYSTMSQLHAAWPSTHSNTHFLADILSVLGMTYAADANRDCLKYKLLGSQEPLGSWGHEYVRHLALEMINEYNARLDMDAPPSNSDLHNIATEMVPFFLKHNAEPDACDLLMELESIDSIVQYLDINTFTRVATYLASSANYLPAPDDVKTLRVVHRIYRKFNKLPESVVIALKLNDKQLIRDDFDVCTDPLEKKQLAYLLARQYENIEVQDDQLNDILSNAKLSEHFLGLARELDVLEPKTPEDIYKSHLENTKGRVTVNVDSARQNLASTFVNAFVNAGFGQDKLMTAAEEGNSWIYKNKDHGMLSAAASLGAILLWDVEMGLTQIDKYLYSTDDQIKAGALLGIGIVNCGVRSESDPAMALLSEFVEDTNVTLRLSCLLGLGLAYVGAAREDVLELVLPTVTDAGLSMQLSAMAALALGMVFVGTCHGDLTSSILQTLMERDEAALKDPYAKFMAVALALLYLGRQDAADATLETLKVIEHPLAKQAMTLVKACSFAATGNVLKIQEMLHTCNDHLDKEDDTFQAFATLGIAIIAMGEEIGSQMALRTLNHLMHYGEPMIRRAVPLALGLLCASNPLVSVLDTLSKYSHDNDQDVALNAIFAMGLVGAGTNNSRLAQMFRQLASYYYKEPNGLFMVRIAQGLLHMGKGTISINPFHSNRILLSQVGTAGLIACLTSFLDAKNLVLDKAHWLLYLLVPAMYPRFLITLTPPADAPAELKPHSTSVRVGQAVDTVGQAGRPKTITGFQTHNTPVLLGHAERAELATDEFVSMSPILEGFVILKKNPEWVDESKDK